MSKSKTVAASVRTMLEAACAGFNGVDSLRAELNNQREGNYSGTVKAALAAGSLESFTEAWSGLKADIASNTKGIARKLGCKLGKEGKDKDGNKTPAPYLIPGGLKVAVSVVSGAMAYGITLADDKGTARSFGEIRKDKAVADKAAAESELSPLARAQSEIRELCAAIADGASGLTITEAAEAAKILANVLRLESGAKEAPEKAEARKAA